MSFHESLTIRILGDSSGLRKELEQVLDSFDDLENRLSSSGSAARELANSFQRLSTASRPIQQVNAQLGQLSHQMRAISGQPIVINVQPAMQALQQLLSMIQRVAAALQALSAMGPRGAGPPLPLGGDGSGRSPRHFAGGGLVTGPGGIDRVPAQLTAGEFVLNRDAVSVLGLTLVEQLNQGSRESLGVPSDFHDRSRLPIGVSDSNGSILEKMLDSRRVLPETGAGPHEPNSGAVKPSPSLTTAGPSIREWPRPGAANSDPAPSVSNFGGIEIHVREEVDLHRLVDDFRKQGISTRNRRG